MEKKHKRFPARLAFMLDNPIRRHFAPPARLISKFNIDSNDVVVDFGCGPGYFAIPLARVARKTIGIDVSTEMLEKAETNSRKEGAQIELIQSDGTKINLADSSVDVVILIHVFHEIENKGEVLTEFRRILRPGGRILIVEKTRGKGFFAGRFGPPIVDASGVMKETTSAGFAQLDVEAVGDDSIVSFRKP